MFRGLTQHSSGHAPQGPLLWGQLHWQAFRIKASLQCFDTFTLTGLQRGLVLKWEQQQFYTITTRSVHTWTHIYLSDRLSRGSCCPALNCTGDVPSSGSSLASGPHSASHHWPSRKVGVLCWMDDRMTLSSQWAMLQAFANYGLTMNINCGKTQNRTDDTVTAFLRSIHSAKQMINPANKW